MGRLRHFYKAAARSFWVALTLSLTVVTVGHAAEMKQGAITAGAGLGLMGATPDGTAFTLNGRAEQFVTSNVSVGPMAQMAFTGGMFLLGVSGQVKYWNEIPDTAHRLKLTFQAGFGLVHAEVLESDTSWLLPIGVGLDYAISLQRSLTADLLLNFTNLENTPQHTAHVMPTVTVGLRF
jgi:hypothetical protein